MCWAARRAWGHQADLGDQLDQPALLWDKDRLAMAGPRVPHQATSALGYMCVNLVKSVSQSTRQGGVPPPSPLHAAHASWECHPRLSPDHRRCCGDAVSWGWAVCRSLWPPEADVHSLRWCGDGKEQVQTPSGPRLGAGRARVLVCLLIPCLRCVRISYGSISASESNPCPARLGRKYREGVQRRSVPRDTLPRHGRQLSLSHFL